jgi:uncharacterized membrane protein YgdD (TMEM256/DUF423 family)
MYRQALTAGSVFAALAVILGAFGAHALKARLTPDQLVVFETGVRYHFYHSFALLITGIVFMAFPHKNLKTASSFFMIGIGLFSGSLYAMTILNLSGKSIGPAGVLTPVGGVFFILGWVFLLSGILKTRK